MKKTIAILCTLLCANSLFSQQWTGNNTTTDPIYRGGPVSVGTTQSYDRFTLGKGNLRMVDGMIKFGYFTPPRGSFRDSYFTIQNYVNPSSPSNVDGLYIYPSHDGLSSIDDVPYESKAFFISSASKIGMGTNTLTCADCDSYRLFVKDGIKTEKLKVEIAANNGWADYVFAKDYKLMPLKELQSYIDDKGHLPEVPTTEEAIKNGIELKEMNILLLKKVEELTLYTLQQQSQIDKQQKYMDEQIGRAHV